MVPAPSEVPAVGSLLHSGWWLGRLVGTLTVSLVSGFSPVEDDIFQILSFSSRSGRFATTDFPVLADSLFFDPLYANNALILWTRIAM